MNLEATINACVLKHAITVLRRINDEAVFEINENGLMCSLVDSGNTQMAQIKLFGDVWGRYVIAETHNAGVDLKKIGGILKRANVKDEIHIAGDAERWHFTRGIHQRSIKPLDLGTIRKIPTRPELPHTVSITLSGREFKEIVAEAEGVGEALRITARSKGVSFDAARFHDADDYHGELPTDRVMRYKDGNPDRLCASERAQAVLPDAQAQYSLDYLHGNIAMDMKISDEVTWLFASDMPCEIRYVRDGCDICHILAPRIEST